MNTLLLRFAPNLAGFCYVVGNLILLASGGIDGDWWQLAAGIFWTVDAVILGLFGRHVRGIEIHAAVSMLGCLCMIVAAFALAEPAAQILFGLVLMSGCALKMWAPSADATLPRPEHFSGLLWYWIRRYPVSVVAIIALSSRPLVILGALQNAQAGLLLSALCWVLGDLFQFLSKKGGYHSELR